MNLRGQPVIAVSEVRSPAARNRFIRPLFVGTVLLVAAVWLFVAIAEDVVTGDRLTVVDQQIAQWLHLHASTGMTRLMLWVSRLHSTIAMSFYAGVVGILFFLRRQWRAIATLVICLGGGMLLNVLLKLAFHRPRPHFADPIITLTTYSFPSGHVAASTIFYALCVVWIFARTRAIHWRLLAVTLAALAIVLVALSRMYLGVHYLSDVVAAFAEGVAWVALWLGALAIFWRKAGAVSNARLPE